MGGKYKCCELGCERHVSGFESWGALRRHIELHEEDEEASREEGGGIGDGGGGAGKTVKPCLRCKVLKKKVCFFRGAVSMDE